MSEDHQRTGSDRTTLRLVLVLLHQMFSASSKPLRPVRSEFRQNSAEPQCHMDFYSSTLQYKRKRTYKLQEGNRPGTDKTQNETQIQTCDGGSEHRGSCSLIINWSNSDIVFSLRDEASQGQRGDVTVHFSLTRRSSLY